MPVGKNSIARAKSSDAKQKTDKQESNSVSYEKIFAEVPAENIFCKKKSEPRKDLIKIIKKYGLIEPLVLRQIEENKFDVLKGDDNFIAAKKSDVKTLPSIIIKCNDSDYTQILKSINYKEKQTEKENKTITRKYQEKSEMPVYLL